MGSKKFFILDGTALAYRAFFALIGRPLISSKGENTSAVYGFTNFLLKILEEEKPDYIAAVFDSSEPTFRHKEYPAYKATREKMPEDMVTQIKRIKQILDAFGIPILEVPGYEADDVIGTLAMKAARDKIQAFMVTADKDFMQLISPGVFMYRPGKSGFDAEIVDEKGVERKFGVKPDQVVDVLGLTGDASDNVPGVKGIGEKTAIPLVKQFGSIENLLENVDKIDKESLKKKLKQDKDNAILSKYLVTIKTDVPLDIDFHSLKESRPRYDEIYKLFNELEFKSLLNRVRLIAGGEKRNDSEPVDKIGSGPDVKLKSIKDTKHKYYTVVQIDDLKKLCDKLNSATLLSIDTETTDISALRAQLLGISFSMRPNEAYYVSIKHDGDLFTQESASRGVHLVSALKLLKPILESKKIPKVGQNLKYDMLVLSNYGVNLKGIEFDSMVASYVLNPDGQHNLDSLAREYLGYKTVGIEELIGKGKAQKNMRDVPVEVVAEYSGEDADIALQLREPLVERLKETNQLELCRKIEFPLIEVLASMEKNGVKIDTEILGQISKELERMIDNLAKEIYRLAGGEFNINSTKQLAEVLFGKLKLPSAKKTKTGFSTDVFVLEELSAEYPIAKEILDYRRLTKLKSTYVDTLPTLINPRTGRVHTSFNQTATATGRLSSSDPNLQNIPIRGEIGKEIRKAFVPGETGWVMVSADYSQIELRIMAHICKDDGLIEAFNNHEDIHRTTAAKVFGVAPENVTSDMRRKAKEVNFGILYGIGPYGLKIRLGISQSEARDVIETYFKRFPRVKEYISSTIEFARNHGYVETLLGRRRYLKNINSRNAAVRQAEERQAINMPIQGTAADMIKIAMINIHREMEKRELRSRMILQVHDELVFEAPKNEARVLQEIVVEKMRSAVDLSVPVDVEIGEGSNWLDAH
jgi:DNA polymerase-1